MRISHILTDLSSVLDISAQRINIDICVSFSENVDCALYNFRKCKLTHKCLHLQHECDGIEQCEDGSDEWNCTCK